MSQRESADMVTLISRSANSGSFPQAIGKMKYLLKCSFDNHGRSCFRSRGETSGEVGDRRIKGGQRAQCLNEDVGTERSRMC